MKDWTWSNVVQTYHKILLSLNLFFQYFANFEVYLIDSIVLISFIVSQFDPIAIGRDELLYVYL